MGVTGTGKTTVGHLVAEALGVAMIDADDLHDRASIERMRSGQPLTDADRRPWLQRLNRRLVDWAEAGSGGLLACSALTADARRILTNGLTGVRFVLLHGDPDLLRRRIVGRTGHFATEALLPSQLDALDPPADAVIVDVAGEPSQVAARVMDAVVGRPVADPVALPFVDRRQAGLVLAERVLAERSALDHHGSVVVGLLRGGVPVALEVARALDAPLAGLAVRKIGAPGQPELALGAVTANGATVVNDGSAASFGLTPTDMAAAAGRAVAEAAAIEQRFRPSGPTPTIDGAVVLVDDGLATGATMRAAVAGVRLDGATEVIVAVPVGAVDTCRVLAGEADRVICAATPTRFGAVGWWYDDFAAVTDDEVREALAGPRR